VEKLKQEHLYALQNFLTKNDIKWSSIPQSSVEYQVLGVFMNDGPAKGTWQYIYRSDKRDHLTVTKHLKKIVELFFKHGLPKKAHA
jgi:hypothetical protein